MILPIITIFTMIILMTMVMIINIDWINPACTAVFWEWQGKEGGFQKHLTIFNAGVYSFAIHKTWKLGPSSSVDNDDDDHTGSNGGDNDNDYYDDDNACEKDGSVDEKYESE